MLPPLVDLDPGQTFHGKEGGLYPGGSNVRPAAHDAAGQKIARGIVPLAANGSPDPVNGRIVIMPVSVSNAYGAWHRGDESDTSTPSGDSARRRLGSAEDAAEAPKR